MVAIVAILTGAAVYVFSSLRDAPGQALDAGREVLRDLAGVAAAFRQGTVETSFLSYATGITGSQRLQFATLEQFELFTRRDRTSVLWGYLALPDVVVEVVAPVEYTYYLDLAGEWRLEHDGRTIRVTAPAIEWNTPAVDASEIRFVVRQGSMLRDESAAMDDLKRTLTELTRIRAAEHVQLVREMGRRKTQEFVETWMAGAFGDGGEYRVEVVFADELPDAEKPVVRRPPG